MRRRLCENFQVPSVTKELYELLKALQIVTSDAVGFTSVLFRNRAALAAENISLRKQLALFQERK
jgi:hypothetical protein